MTDQLWRERAACRGLHPNLFHGERGDSQALRQAVAVCNGTDDKPGCPVKADCHNWIINTYTSDQDCYGIYAGLTPNQRTLIRRNRNIERVKQRHVEREVSIRPASPAPDAPAVVVSDVPADRPATSDPATWIDRYEAELLARLEAEQTGRNENTATR